MPVYANGPGSYVGIAQKASPTGWGGSVVNTGLKTFPNLSGGPVVSPVQGKALRRSVATPMGRASQTYQTMNVANIAWATEYVHDPTAWKPLFLWVFGKRVNSGANPYVDTFTVTNPGHDAGTDSGSTFYNHSASFHAFLTDGTNVAGKHVVDDAVCTQFQWEGVANGATTVSFQGVGRNFGDSGSSVAFTDQAGSILSHKNVEAGANSGIYVDTNSPPTTALVCDSFRFTFARPMDVSAQLGAASGNTMRNPTPSNSPACTGQLHLAMAYEDLTTGTDAKQVLTDFAAGTNYGVLLTYYISPTEYLQVKCHGAVDPGVLNNPQVAWGPSGRATLEFDIDLYPDTLSTDFAFIMGTSSNA